MLEAKHLRPLHKRLDALTVAVVVQVAIGVLCLGLLLAWEYRLYRVKHDLRQLKADIQREMRNL